MDSDEDFQYDDYDDDDDDDDDGKLSKNTLQPPFLSRPSLKMTALSYS